MFKIFLLPNEWYSPISQIIEHFAEIEVTFPFRKNLPNFFITSECLSASCWTSFRMDTIVSPREGGGQSRLSIFRIFMKIFGFLIEHKIALLKAYRTSFWFYVRLELSLNQKPGNLDQTDKILYIEDKTYQRPIRADHWADKAIWADTIEPGLIYTQYYPGL